MKITDKMRLNFIDGLLLSEGRMSYYRAYQLFKQMDRRIKFSTPQRASKSRKGRV